MEEDLQNDDDVPIVGEKKIVVVGHNGCGKSSLIASFVTESPIEMTESIPKEIRKVICFGRESVQVVLREEQSDPHFSFERILDYGGTNAALVCFAFNDAKSIRSIPKWLNEIVQYCQTDDLFVVGCKVDLKHQTPVSAWEWMKVERAIYSYPYLECSAKTGEGISHLVRVVGNALMKQQSENYHSHL